MLYSDIYYLFFCCFCFAFGVNNNQSVNQYGRNFCCKNKWKLESVYITAAWEAMSIEYSILPTPVGGGAVYSSKTHNCFIYLAWYLSKSVLECKLLISEILFLNCKLLEVTMSAWFIFSLLFLVHILHIVSAALKY